MKPQPHGRGEEKGVTPEAVQTVASGVQDVKKSDGGEVPGRVSRRCSVRRFLGAVEIMNGLELENLVSLGSRRDPDGDLVAVAVAHEALADG